MPHCRMQHNAALLLGKSCSAYTAKLITSKLKKNYLPTIFIFTKTVEWETPKHHMPHQKLHLHYSWWQILARQTFDDTDTSDRIFMPHGILQHAATFAVLTSTLFSAFVTQQSHIVVRSALRVATSTAACSFSQFSVVCMLFFFLLPWLMLLHLFLEMFSPTY